MVPDTVLGDNDVKRRFGVPPWTVDTPQCQAIEATLPPDHLARRIEQAVGMLDLTPLYNTYTGRGRVAHPPDVMLKVILYEVQRGRCRPSQWAEDHFDSRAVSWLAGGLRVSRARWYAFRDRLAKVLQPLHRQLLQIAQSQGVTEARRASIDGTSIAAHASRHRLLNTSTLDNRLAALAQAVTDDSRTQEVPATSRPWSSSSDGRPAWMAPTVAGRGQQLKRYERCREHLKQRLDENQQRRADKRRAPEDVRIAVGDPEAPLGQDKSKVYRPLYNVQLLRDLDSPLILAYDVFAQSSDVGTLKPMARRHQLFCGRRLEQLLGDAGYASALDVAKSDASGLELFAPYCENDFSAIKQSKRTPRQLPKRDFVWLPEAQLYQCPGGHWLQRESRELQRRTGGQRLEVVTYRCPPMYCMACEQATMCVKDPQKGRTVKRHEHQDKVEALQARMATPQAKALYKLRGQTVELSFADIKEHRSLRRFSGCGLTRARTEVGLITLAHNGLTVQKALQNLSTDADPRTPPKRRVA